MDDDGNEEMHLDFNLVYPHEAWVFVGNDTGQSRAGIGFTIENQAAGIVYYTPNNVFQYLSIGY